MRSPAPTAGTIGRDREIRRIDDLLRAARGSRGSALVLQGDAGIGKSTLLEYARRPRTGCRIIEAAGSEFETELPFAGLHQLCAPMLGELPELPEPIRAALEVAFGLRPGTPEPFLVGLATLTLLGSGPDDRPVVCLVDDAQWLDTASSKALAFVARRLASEPVAMIFARRPHDTPNELDELPRLTVGGLTDAESRAVLAAQSHVALDAQVRDHIVAEARGNPLALRELPKAGGFGPPDPAPVPSRIERGYQDRLAGLPDDARMLLTVAAADPTGSPALLWPAAQWLGLDVAVAGAAATATGLVEFGTRVRFGHPLARSGVYRAASPERRRTAHRALAQVTDPAADPDRRAWHRAQACAGPDDDVAAELTRSAAVAGARGGAQAAAAFLERAAALTLDPGTRIGRTIEAAQASLDAGRAEAATDLLATVENAGLDDRQQARADLIRGRLAFVRPGDGNSGGATFMVRAAQRLATVDPASARASFLDAAEMSLAVGRASGVLSTILAEARRTAPAAHAPDVLDALLILVRDGHRAAVPLMRRVLAETDPPLWRRHPALALMLTSELRNPDAHAAIAAVLLRTGRESGAPLAIRLGLAQTASHAVLTGDLDRAMTAIAEEEAIADATGGTPVSYHRLQLAAMRGRRQEAAGLLDSAAATPAPGQLAANAHWAAALLNNGLADYPAALRAARRAQEQDDLFLTGLVLPELIEAAVRCGHADEAAGALESLAEQTDDDGSDSAHGISAYARGLVTGREDDFGEAVERLAHSPLVPYRARAHLLYGEWLRRAGRRRDCRHELRTAHSLFADHGIEAFARRAADELQATGEVARSRGEVTYDKLTMQELYIARQVATGATSQEVATRLFLSTRTVEAHLRNIFRKLGISSRRQLRDLPGVRPGPADD